MPFMVLTASVAAIAGTDYSNRCGKIELSAEVEEKDVTTFASLGWKEVLGGLKSGSLGLGFKNNRTAADLDDDMWGFFGTVQTFFVQATTGAVTSSNPRYSGSVLIKEWKPLMGSVGDVDELDVTFPTSGVITRATAT